MMSRILVSQKGFSLAEALVGLGVMAIIGLGVTSLVTSAVKKQKTVITDSDINLLKEIVLQNILNGEAFSNTLKNAANSATFSCLNNNSDCLSAGGEFKIFDRNNNLISLSSLSSETSVGFNSEGISCNNFGGDSGAGDDNCPFKYVATWAPECFQTQNIQGKVSKETACRDPLIKINIIFTPKFLTQTKFSVINSKKMQITLVKSQNDIALTEQGKGSLSKMCQAIAGGLFDSETLSCIVPTTNILSCENSCGAGRQSLVKGFNTDGSPKCLCTIAEFVNCNPPGTIGQVVSTITDNGTLICSNGVVPGLVSSGNINNPPILFGSGDGSTDGGSTDGGSSDGGSSDGGSDGGGGE